MFDGGPVSAADLHPPLPSGELVPLRLVTVLLAEDHAVIRQALRVLIESTGLFAVVGEVADGAEAVETALALNPDVILMDVSMPVLDGLAATQQILKTNPAARILILSANSERECLERTVAVGALGYLRK